MTPAILREALIRRKGRVDLAEFLSGRKPHEVEQIRDSLDFLADLDLIVRHPDGTVQARTGSGRLVEADPHVKVQREGLRPIGTLPCMAEGSVRAAAKKRKTSEDRIAAAIPALRDGATLREVGITWETMRSWKETRPEDAARVREAEQQGKAKRRADQERAAAEAVRRGATSISDVARMLGWSHERASDVLVRAKAAGMVLTVGIGNARRYRVARRAAA